MGKKNQNKRGEKLAGNQHGHPRPKIAKEHSSKKSKQVQISAGKPKSTNLFQIIPENDDFAALGYDDDEEIVEGEQQAPEKFGGEEDDQSYDGHVEQEEQGEDVELNGDEQEWQGQEQGNFEENGEQGEDMQGQGDFQEGQEGDFQNYQGQNGQQYQQNEKGQMAMDEQHNKQPVDASVLSLQIQQTINVLMNIERLGDGKPRKHYVSQLKQLFHQYYGYNFQLIDHFLSFMNPAEIVQLFQANQTQRPLTIRTNTLKTRRKELAQNLIQRGVNLDPLAQWSKVGIKIYQSKVPIGATPEYLAGHYMLQSASSLLPVLALDPQPGEKVLDLASAPGGKTTYIAQLMKNTGCIFANDLKKERLKALQFNLYRLGVTNTTVTCRDGRKYSKIFPSSFDRVLLDAPCTGLGIISKDHSIKANRLQLDIYKNSHVQKELILSAIDCTRVGGIVVYSTCSISPQENEEVVNFALKKRFVKVEEIEVEVGEEGLTKFIEKRYHPDLRKTRRIYPHVHNMDGFYVARLVKVGKGKRVTESKEEERLDQ